MSLKIQKIRFQEGHWEGLVDGAGDTAPEIEVLHQAQVLSGVSLTQHPSAKGAWLLTVPVPPHLLSDGIQTFLITDASNSDVLGKFSILAGDPLDEDLRAELDLLRAELDLLKTAFRRHCAENPTG